MKLKIQLTEQEILEVLEQMKSTHDKLEKVSDALNKELNGNWWEDDHQPDKAEVEKLVKNFLTELSTGYKTVNNFCFITEKKPENEQK